MSRPPVSGAGARDQVARLLTLVPFVHQHGGVRLEEAASLLGVSTEQVLRDLKVLFMCGLPGGLPDDLIDVDLDALETDQGSPVTDGVIRVENADYLSRPLQLTATEASALVVALRMLRDSSNPDTAALVDSVLAKIDHSVASAAPAHVDVRPSAQEVQQVASAAVTGPIDQAVATGRQLRLSYFVESRGEESTRVVDPRGIAQRGIFRYLDAWCHTANDERLFRLDRIQRLQVLDTPISTPRVPPRSLDEGLFRDVDRTGSTLVTLRLDPQARWATDYYPMHEVRPTSDGGAEVDLVVVDQRWLMRLLMRLAPHARVVRPDEIADLFIARTQGTLSLYR